MCFFCVNNGDCLTEFFRQGRKKNKQEHFRCLLTMYCIDDDAPPPWKMKQRYIGDVARKYRMAFAHGDSVHLLRLENMSFAMISSGHFTSGWSNDGASDATHELVKELYRHGIYAFSCYNQHHGIVFYYDNRNKTYITPEHLARLLHASSTIRNILSKYAQSSFKSWSKNYIETFYTNEDDDDDDDDETQNVDIQAYRAEMDANEGVSSMEKGSYRSVRFKEKNRCRFSLIGLDSHPYVNASCVCNS